MGLLPLLFRRPLPPVHCASSTKMALILIVFTIIATLWPCAPPSPCQVLRLLPPPVGGHDVDNRGMCSLCPSDRICPPPPPSMAALPPTDSPFFPLESRRGPWRDGLCQLHPRQCACICRRRRSGRRGGPHRILSLSLLEERRPGQGYDVQASSSRAATAAPPLPP